MVKSFTNFSSFSTRKLQTIEQLHQFIAYKFSFKICHRLNEPDVLIKGNYLTFALLNHCGTMAQCLVQLPIPGQLSVENNLLRYYRFSRHDETTLKYLLEQDRLNFGYEQIKQIVEFFNKNCHPLYDATVNNDEIASEEYVRDKDRFRQFQIWLDQHYCSHPKALTTLARNMIVNHYLYYDECNNNNNNNEYQSTRDLQNNICKMVVRFNFIQKYLGKQLFEYIFSSTLSSLFLLKKEIY